MRNFIAGNSQPAQRWERAVRPPLTRGQHSRFDLGVLCPKQKGCERKFAPFSFPLTIRCYFAFA